MIINYKKNKILKFIIILSILCTLILLSIKFIILHLKQDFIYKSFNIQCIENELISTGSEIYDSKEVLMGKLFAENRIIITYKELPKNLINAVLSKEDIRFHCHSGLDFKSLLRAISSLGQKGGGSTVSQQLAKLLFTSNYSKSTFKRLFQKILESILSVEIEKYYTKEEILTMYFNKFDFLYNAKGIEMASRTYFNKKTSELNLNESATIVGMLENPYLYNPRLHTCNAIKQRNLILKKMKKYNFITNEDYIKIYKQSIKLHFNAQNKNIILNTYYSKFLKEELFKLVKKYKKDTGKKFNLYSNGLKVYTSIDLSMQKYAELSIKKHLCKLQNIFNHNYYKNSNIYISNIIKKTKKFQKLKKKGIQDYIIIKIFKKPENLKIFTWEGNIIKKISKWQLIKYNKNIIQAGLLSIESYNGFIKAWVGGIDFNYFKYDHVYQSKRQSGSIFKPFVFTSVIDLLHLNPNSIFANEKIIYKNWNPKNITEKYGGYVTLKEALAYSINTIPIKLLSLTTPKTVIDLVKKIGIKSYIPNDLSIALGSSDLTLYELTSAFNTFNNYGYYIKPRLLLKIENKYGKLIKFNEKLSYKVIKYETSFMILKLMQEVTKYGTAKSLKYYGITNEVAAKTGTSNNYSDGWFVGIVPNLTTLIWVGWEDKDTHFENIYLGQGSKTTLPIWAYYMLYLYEDIKLKYNKNDNFKNYNNIKYNWEGKYE